MTSTKRFAFGFGFGILIFVLVNVVQIAIDSSLLGDDTSYGFPYPFYEYIGFLNRGRFWIDGIVMNLFVAIIFSLSVAVLVSLYHRYKPANRLSIVQSTDD